MEVPSVLAFLDDSTPGRPLPPGTARAFRGDLCRPGPITRLRPVDRRRTINTAAEAEQ
jgi:hypothetical protein